MEHSQLLLGLIPIVNFPIMRILHSHNFTSQCILWRQEVEIITIQFKTNIFLRVSLERKDVCFTQIHFIQITFISMEELI
jgi:hypothetical protein